MTCEYCGEDILCLCEKGSREMNRPTSAELNGHLECGGVVQVTTYMISRIYTQKHAGMFFENAGSLFVKHGKRSEQLSQQGNMLVSIRKGRIK